MAFLPGKWVQCDIVDKVLLAFSCQPISRFVPGTMHYRSVYDYARIDVYARVGKGKGGGA